MAEQLDIASDISAAHCCAAPQCPMAGSLADGVRKDVWWCAYHLAAPETDLERISAVLRTHGVLLRIANEGRTCIARQPAAVHRQQWELLQRRFEQWRGEQADPSVWSIAAFRAQTFSAWLNCIETMLGGFVQRAVQTPRRRGV
jgi:hypothetical protein